MRSERLLGWLMALLAMQGSTMLAMGSGNITLPALTIFAALTSLYVTDRMGWFSLSTPLAGAAASGAVLVAFYDFFELQQDRQLLAIAYLLVYLQVVLLYQKKTERIYWQLQLLSLLQVVVAAALNLTLLFGFLLLIYLFFSLWCGFVFFVARQRKQQRFFTASATSPSNGSNFFAEGIAEVQAADFHPRLALLALRQSLVIGVLAFVTFLLLPRMSDSTSYRNVIGARVIGFTNSVRLGELGTAIENKEPVLRIWFYHPGETEPFKLLGPPMLRGAIVNYYQNGTWSIAGGQLWNGVVELPAGETDATRQRIAMDSQQEPTIFAVFPPAVLDPRTPVAFNMRTKQLVRTVPPSIPLDFVLTTPGIRHRRQLELTPADAFDSVGGAATLQPFDPAREPSLSTRRLQVVQSLAEEILAENEIPAEKTIERAKALCQYLKTSPRFTYSLRGADRDEDLDPIVDFLSENPQGHCEYFSSALTLMLRSVGIRSRMVIGFQGGEWNPLGSYYQVRQQDAHSWTEAYIPAGELENMPSGGWLRLDPTPGRTRMASQANMGAVARYYQQMRNYTDFLWSKYVIQLDGRRQREDIYGKLTDWGSTLRAWLARGLFAEQASGVSSSAGPRAEAAASESAPSWWWTPIIGGLCILLLTCGLWLLRKLYRAGLATGGATRAPQAAIEARPFYRRWKRLLVRHTAARRPGQSPRQYAAAISTWLVECGLGELQDAPYRLVDAHYAYVFGGILPSAETEAELTETVKSIDKALASGRPHGLKTR